MSEHQVRLVSNAVASWASSLQVRLEVKNWIQRQFRGETKPLKHRFSPPRDQTYFFTSETINRSCSATIKTKDKLVRRRIFGLQHRSRHVKTYRLILCHQKVGLIRGPKQCFEGFVSSRIASYSIFWPLSRLGAILATVPGRQWTM